jgi:hypothetical protein
MAEARFYEHYSACGTHTQEVIYLRALQLPVLQKTQQHFSYL